MASVAGVTLATVFVVNVVLVVAAAPLYVTVIVSLGFVNDVAESVIAPVASLLVTAIGVLYGAVPEIVLPSASFATIVSVAVDALGPWTWFGVTAKATEDATGLNAIVAVNGVAAATVAVPVPVPSTFPAGS
jgi:hypothetical protein